MTSRAGLRRELGLLDAVGIGFGAIVGAGIFVVTGVAAGIAGAAFLVGLFVAAVAPSGSAPSSSSPPSTTSECDVPAGRTSRSSSFRWARS